MSYSEGVIELSDPVVTPLSTSLPHFLSNTTMTCVRVVNMENAIKLNIHVRVQGLSAYRVWEKKGNISLSLSN